MSYSEVFRGSVQGGKDYVPEWYAAHLKSDFTFHKSGRVFAISLNERRITKMYCALSSGLASVKMASL